MQEKRTHSVTVRYQQIDFVLHFSYIKEIPLGRQALIYFINDMSRALLTIRHLRLVIAETEKVTDAKVAEACFCTVIQAVSDYYDEALAYARESTQVAQPVNDIESRRLLDFELNAGPCVRELCDAMAVLKGCTKVPIYDDRPTNNLKYDPRDWCIDHLIKLVRDSERRIFLG